MLENRDQGLIHCAQNVYTELPAAASPTERAIDECRDNPWGNPLPSLTLPLLGQAHKRAVLGFPVAYPGKLQGG
jgi:hypothetical protein